MDKKYGICDIYFHSPGCGVIVHFDEENRIDRLEPDPDAPVGKILCPIAKSFKEIIYSGKRLKHPLKRIGARGTYEFEEISWDVWVKTRSEIIYLKICAPTWRSYFVPVPKKLAE